MMDDERKIYHTIITKCWTAFSKGRPYPDFSDEWWERIIADFNEICAEYQGTPFENFVK